MKEDDKYSPGSSREEQPGIDPLSPVKSSAGGERREPVFTGFDAEEDDTYEEPDRDTDYASSYREDRLDEEEFDDALVEEEEFDGLLLEEEEDYEEVEDTFWDESEPSSTPQDIDSAAESPWEEDATSPQGLQRNHPDQEDDDNDWTDEEDYPDDDAGDVHQFPLGLILVAIVALLLLAAGGYGVIQQRAVTQEEIRQLQAALATAANPAAVSTSRDALQKVQEQNTRLQAAADALTLENRRLSDIVAGLESQLQAQREAVTQPAAATPGPAAVKAATKPAAPQPAAPKPTAAVTTGAPWFVNFGSYGQRAAAESRAAKLHPTGGTVVVTAGSKDGKTFYRVRVVELTSREAAEKIARQLESEYGLSKLWVGKR